MPRLQVEVKDRIDVPRTQKVKWITVEDLKWVLKQSDLPPILPISLRRYHHSYVGVMASLDDSLELVGVRLLAITEAEKRERRMKEIESIAEKEKEHSLAPQKFPPTAPIHSVTKGSAEEPKAITKSPRCLPTTKIIKKRNYVESQIEHPGHQSIKVEPGLNEDYTPVVVDLLESHRGGKYVALDDAMKEDLEVVDKVKDLLSSQRGSEECVSKAQVARRIRMVLGGMRLRIVPITRQRSQSVAAVSNTPSITCQGTGAGGGEV